MWSNSIDLCKGEKGRKRYVSVGRSLHRLRGVDTFQSRPNPIHEGGQVVSQTNDPYASMSDCPNINIGTGKSIPVHKR